MHADVRKLNVACFSKKADSHATLVRFRSLMVAGTVFGQKGRYLQENNNMLLGGIRRDHPQFQEYIAFHTSKIIRCLIIHCKRVIQKFGLDPWVWFRNGVDDFNTNWRDVLHEGVYQAINKSMSGCKPRKEKLGGLPNITYIHRKPKPLGTELKTMCDCETCVMVYIMEVLKGKSSAMREKICSRTWDVYRVCATSGRGCK
jgi:hypothetical protein